MNVILKFGLRIFDVKYELVIGLVKGFLEIWYDFDYLVDVYNILIYILF